MGVFIHYLVSLAVSLACVYNRFLFESSSFGGLNTWVFFRIIKHYYNFLGVHLIILLLFAA